MFLSFYFLNGFSFSDETSSTNGTHILTELSSALNRLQATLLEEKDVVTDTRKRNTILTLVAWLKRILQTSSNDSTAIDTLTDLLPTELLLSRLMPQLADADANGGMSGAGETATLDRSVASSKRFNRQRNKRFNTVGVSREELADARLYLQKKLLSENLASSGTSSSSGHASMEHQNILDDDSESRRKSLNLQFDNDLNADLDHILAKGRSSFSKSIDIVPPANRNIIIATALPKLDAEPKVVLRRKPSAPTSENQQRHQTNGNGPQRHNGKTNNNDVNQNSDTEDDTSECHSHVSNGGVAVRPMNKFSLRKLKMKRANTIDIPKSQPNDDFNVYACSDENGTETSVQSNASSSVNGVRRTIQAQAKQEVDKNHIPSLQMKTAGDQKYLSFLNKQNSENRLSWMNPSRGSISPQGKVGANWSNKFGNIKNSFERSEPPVSPGLAKKNSFTHAPTSPFMPVHSNKPPPIPNGHSQYHQVSQKIAAIQSNELADRHPMEQRPQLKSQKSLPSETKHSSKKERTAPIWSNKFASVDNAIENMPTSFNPLYVPLHQNTAKSAQIPPRSPIKTPNSPLPQHGEFPAYTYTCTDYTRPTCVSTFGPDQVASPVKTQILPDTSYIRNQSPQHMVQAPSLGTTKLSKNMKAIDYTSSSECLSESNSSYRSPHPFATNRIYADNSYNDTKVGDEQEFMATSQIMKYPESQMATMVVNKTKRYDQDEERVAKNLHSFLTNNVHAKPHVGDYPANDAYFSHVNKTYVPAVATAAAPNAIRNNVSGYNKFNNFVSMENLSYQPKPIQPAVALKSATSTHALNAQSLPTNSAPVANERKFAPAKNQQQEKSKPTQVIKVNSYGSQYMPPKVMDPAFDGTPFQIQKKDYTTMNSLSNLSRSNTIVHRRPPPIEVKRKQSLPGQGTDYASLIDDRMHSPPSHDREYDDGNANEPRNNYLPTGILKRSKSGHTLALLQQFESKERTNGPSMPQPTLPPQPLKSALKQTNPQAPKPAPRSNPIETKPTDVVKTHAAPVQPTQPSPKHLDAPKITETPSSPIVDEERIIYPGQTSETTNKIKNYAQALNAMHSRKTTINSAVISEEIMTGPIKGILQKSKSGTMLALPKPFESNINKADADEKQRTVAAYFSGVKSPQGLQRSASQHSVLSSSSTKSLKTSNENIDINGNNTEIVDRTLSTFGSSAIMTNIKSTTKSAHHLKILKKQQNQSATNALPLAKSQTMPHISSVNLLDENNVDDAFEDLFLSFNK